MSRILSYLLLAAVLGAGAAFLTACGTARDGEAGQASTSNVSTAPALHEDDEHGDEHMTGVMEVAHEEGDEHGVELHEVGPGHADPPIRTIELVAYDIGFSPEKIEIPAGVPVRLVLKNEGALEHDISITIEGHAEVMSMDDHEEAAHGGHSEGGAEAVRIHIHAMPGESNSETFMVESPGEHHFACEIPGHREAGMVGSLHVEEHSG